MANRNGNSSNPTAIHLSLQGKGGVGKSLVASILAQYFLSRSRVVNCIDTDPVNGTLSQYAALGAQRLKLLLRDGSIDSRSFDDQPLIKNPGGCEFYIRVNRDILFDSPHKAAGPRTRWGS